MTQFIVGELIGLAIVLLVGFWALSTLPPYRRRRWWRR